jgi:hypothetical protein
MPRFFGSPIRLLGENRQRLQVFIGTVPTLISNRLTGRSFGPRLHPLGMVLWFVRELKNQDQFPMETFRAGDESILGER